MQEFSNTNHPDHNVTHQYVKQKTDTFKSSYSVHNRKHDVICPLRNEAVEDAVLGHVQKDNQQSTSSSNL